MSNKVKRKSHRGAAKRFKLSASGKVRFRRAERAHGNTKKTRKIMRQRRSNGVMNESNAKIVREMIV